MAFLPFCDPLGHNNCKGTKLGSLVAGWMVTCTNGDKKVTRTRLCVFWTQFRDVVVNY
jgi:hypothetical protein